MSTSRLNTEQLGRAFASSADAPASRSAVRRRRIVILVWCTTVALAISAVIGLSVWQGVQEKKKSRNLDFPLQSVQLDGFISNPSGDLQMKKMNNVLMAGAVASAASLGMCVDASAQSSAVQWTTASGGNGHWYQRNAQLMTWAQATAHAINIGGTLATTTTSSELEFIRSQLITDGAVCWLGGTIDCSGADGVCCTNCVWRWSNGENFNVAWSGWIPQNGFTTERLVTNGTGFDDMCSPCSIQDFRPPSIIEWSADCNSDGIVDYGQILSGQLIDANSNGIPDICEVDQCPGDISGNGVVDGVDLTLLLGVWGTDGIGGEFDADITNDGIVGGADLTVLFSGWGPCPPPILPWATVLEQNVNPAVVTDATLRNAITATGLPWRVRDNGTNIEMLLVPGGTFMMGCSTGDDECGSDERPAHQVTLTDAFYLGKTEVTQAQWTAEMGSNPSAHQGNTQFPVEMVSWTMAQSFCTTADLRLPTEAEWEYACRGRTITSRYGVLEDIAWYGGNSIGTQTVATKLPNALGLYDMPGNVHEWCQDSYRFYTTDSVTNPIGSGSGRLHRGGSINDGANLLRASWRSDAYDESFWWHHVGFRVARNP